MYLFPWQIAPNHLGVDQPHLSESDPTKLAELVLANAVKMKCRKFVRAKDIVKGNTKLNLAFVCNLFNNFPALEPAEEELPNLEETREEKTFRNWMNSMGVRPFVQNLFLDLDDGCVLLQLFELVKYLVLNNNFREFTVTFSGRDKTCRSRSSQFLLLLLGLIVYLD